MTKISYISWGGYDKGFYGKNCCATHYNIDYFALPLAIRNVHILISDFSDLYNDKVTYYIESNRDVILQKRIKFGFEFWIFRESSLKILDVIQNLKIYYLCINICKSDTYSHDFVDKVIKVIRRCSLSSRFVFVIRKNQKYHNFRAIDSAKLDVIRKIFLNEITIQDVDEIYKDEQLSKYYEAELEKFYYDY